MIERYASLSLPSQLEKVVMFENKFPQLYSTSLFVRYRNSHSLMCATNRSHQANVLHLYCVGWGSGKKKKMCTFYNNYTCIHYNFCDPFF